MEILDPEYATRSASVPIVLSASSLEEEIAFARSLMADNARQQAKDSARRPHRGCIVVAGFTFYEIKIFADRIGLPVLDGTQDAMESELFLSDLEQTKGYEFDTVAILNCEAEVLPPTGAPAEETFRYACQLYVAMTRARDQLVLSYSTTPSRWLLNKASLGYDDWQAFFARSEIECAGQPGFLPEFPESDDPVNALMESTGREFIYTVYARGLPTDVQDKLEELVSGTAVLRGGHRVQWENVGQLLDDMRNRPRAGYIFGPTTEKVVLNALESAARGGRLTAHILRKKRQIKIKPLPDVIFVPKKIGSTADGKLSLGVSDLNIDSHTIRYLKEANVITIGDLLKVSSFALRRSPNFGQRRIEVIRGALEALGYEW